MLYIHYDTGTDVADKSYYYTGCCKYKDVSVMLIIAYGSWSIHIGHVAGAQFMLKTCVINTRKVELTGTDLNVDKNTVFLYYIFKVQI